MESFLGYDDGPWDIRLAATYRDNYLDEVGSKPLNDRYTDDHMQLDLTAKYKVNDSLRLTFEAINLNDEPEYYYFGNSQDSRNMTSMELLTESDLGTS